MNTEIAMSCPSGFREAASETVIGRDRTQNNSACPRRARDKDVSEIIVNMAMFVSLAAKYASNGPTPANLAIPVTIAAGT